MKVLTIVMLLAVTSAQAYDWQAERDRRDYNYYQEQQLEVQQQQLYLEQQEQYDRRRQQIKRDHQELMDRAWSEVDE